MASSLPISVPERLGKYQVIQVLGRGAMGVVFLGLDPVIKRRVAIKTIRKELVDDDEMAVSVSARFRREAQAAGALNHPGIVSVYEYGEDDKYAFIAMEYVEGNTLRQYLSRGASFDENDTVSIMAQLLEALEFAHNASVWHRDIKPANIIIMKNGRIKLADFGIARIESADRTRANVLMGTPGYIAPEYYLGEAIDHRIDIFSAGVVFYELLAGEAPFRGRPEAIMHDVCYDDPVAPSEIARPQRWPRYDPVVARALEKSPAQRFQTAAAFRAALLAEYAQPVATTVAEATIVSAALRPIAVDSGMPSASKTPPFLASTMAPSDWSTPVLAGIEFELARLIGPVAKVLVRRAARQHKDIDSLVRALLDSLDSDADRERFTRAVTGRAVVAAPAAPAAGSSARAAAGAAHGPAVSPQDVEHATKLLLQYIGPIARVVTRRAAAGGVSRHDFFQEVARNVEDAAQRERFLREALASGA